MKRLLYVLVMMCLTATQGCGDVQCDSDADCADGEVCADAGGVLFASRVCVATSDISNNTTSDMASDLATPDMAADMSMADGGDDLGMTTDMQTDMGVEGMDMSDPDMPCVPRSSQDICAARGAECGSPEVEECGATITVNCGQCDSPDVCQNNDCVCEPETNPDFCSRFGANCGMVTNLDNCGEMRTANCGTCSGNQQCGEQAPNVCGCPCDINGTCYPENAVNPANSCQICDPQRSTTRWSIDAGRSCSDGDLCTENDVCQSNGSCGGDAVICTTSSSCRTSSCNPATGACVDADEPDGIACPGPGPNCVSHTCQSGACQSSIDSNSCLIGGDCYDDLVRNPSELCEICDPGTSQTSWTIAVNQQCNTDGNSCTIDICNPTGQCTHPVRDGRCLINGTCYNDGDRNPSAECQWCDSSLSKTAWVNAPPGESCADDGVTCTDDICDGSGACDHPIASNQCYINLNCYNSGETSGFDCCRGCNPSQSQTIFTSVNNGLRCSNNCGGGPAFCDNGVCSTGMELCIPDACPIQ